MSPQEFDSAFIAKFIFTTSIFVLIALGPLITIFYYDKKYGKNEEQSLKELIYRFNKYQKKYLSHKRKMNLAKAAKYAGKLRYFSKLLPSKLVSCICGLIAIAFAFGISTNARIAAKPPPELP